MADMTPSTSVLGDEMDSKEVDASFAPLSHFVDHPDHLADHTLSSIDWSDVESMMPRILKGKSQEDVKLLLLAEIDGMSKKRLLAVLNGLDFEESSSSDEESDDGNGNEDGDDIDENEELNMEVSENMETEVMGDKEVTVDEEKLSDGIVDSSEKKEDGEIETDSDEEEVDEQKAFDNQIDKELEDFFD